MANGEDLSKYIISISILPSDYAITYNFMYAFGNHLWVKTAKWHLSTLDSRVVAMFEQECCSHSSDRNPIIASLEYVGWIEEILELDFGGFQTIMLPITRVQMQQWNTMNMGSFQ